VVSGTANITLNGVSITRLSANQFPLLLNTVPLAYLADLAVAPVVPKAKIPVKEQTEAKAEVVFFMSAEQAAPSMYSVEQ
jgi:hypothetical protein